MTDRLDVSQKTRARRGLFDRLPAKYAGPLATCIVLLVVFGLLTHGRYGSIPAVCDLVCHYHARGTDCASCHKTEGEQWASRENLHSASAAKILGDPAHNSDEVVKDDCLLCHSMFQAVSLHAVVDSSGTVSAAKIATAAYGPADDPSQAYYQNAISHFVEPVNATGPWKIKNRVDWQATKCEVCHDATSKATNRLAKYGAWLDTQPKPDYIQLKAGMPTAYQFVLGSKGYVRTDYVHQSALAVQATRLCVSCHDPSDQGSDPTTSVAGRDFGPQGGDSRSYVTTSHAGLGCVDCHKPHTFASEEDTEAVFDRACNRNDCHTTASKLAGPADPGVVHTNHIQ